VTGLALRPYASDDIAALVDLHAASFEDAWPRNLLEPSFTIPGTAALIATREGVPVGFILYRLIVDEAEILTFCVAPGERRKGVARRLLHGAIEALKGKAKTLFLEVAEDNHAARSLYRVMGFAELGRRGGYYHRGESMVDALMLRLAFDEVT